MGSLIDSAAAILSSHERKLEATSQNIANASTIGYKKQVSFSQLLNKIVDPTEVQTSLTFSPDMSQGRITETGNPLDLAIFGPAMFLLRDGDRFVYSRSGEFSRDENGAVANAQGMILQQAGGGDLILETTAVEILDDGTVLSDGLPVGTVGLFEKEDSGSLDSLSGSLFSASENDMTEAGSSYLRQGMVEGSNVTLSDEMIAMMKSVRQAESGARIVQFYDQLMGQAITSFSRSNR